MNIQDFLFRASAGRASEPLFKNASDLAQAFCDRAGGPFAGRKPDSMRAFVSQVLRVPSDSGARPASPNFMSELEYVVRERSDEEKAEENWTTARELLLRLKDPTASYRPRDEKQDWQELLREARTRETVVVMTPRPAETQVQKEKANLLTQILIERAIVPDHSSEWTECRYQFFIAARRDAEDMIAGLIDRLAIERTDGDRTKAAALLKNAEDDGRLEIRASDGGLFMVPMCVFDTWDRHKMTGFVFFYHENDHVSVAKMDADTLKDWRRTYNLMLADEKWKSVSVSGTPPAVDQVLLPASKSA